MNDYHVRDGGMSVDALPIKDFEKRIEQFYRQPHEDMCFSVGFVNSLRDLSIRKNIKGLSIGLSEMNTLCGYKEGFQCAEDIAILKINRRIQSFGYKFIVKRGKKNRIDDIFKIWYLYS